MGFNFGVLKLDGGRLVSPDWNAPPIHDPACYRMRHAKPDDPDPACMCEYGFDCYRHTDDRNFYSALLECGIVTPPGGGGNDDVAFRITDFDKAHALADTMECEINRPRFHYLVDLLKKDETLYVEGC